MALVFVFAACHNNSQKNSNDGQPAARETAKTAAANQISVQELPADIINFIANSHAGFMMENAVHVKLCNGADAIAVNVVEDTEPGVALIFSPEGAYIQTEHNLSYVLSPDFVQNAVREKFAEYLPSDTMQVLTFENDAVQYQVQLLLNGIFKQVILDEQGNVVCER